MNRRRLLHAVGALGTAALSGCVGDVVTRGSDGPLPDVPYGGVVVFPRGHSREIQPFECRLVVEEAGSVLHESTHVVEDVEGAPSLVASGEWTDELHDFVARVTTPHYEATFHPRDHAAALEGAYESSGEPVYPRFWLLSESAISRVSPDPPAATVHDGDSGLRA